MPLIATEFVLLLSSADDANARRTLEDYAVMLCEQARNRGWKACAIWTEEKLKVRFQDGSAEAMRAFLDPLVGNAKTHGAALSILEEQDAGAPICQLDDALITWGTIVHARLTRDLLCALPEGAYVAAVSEEDRAASVGRLGPFHVRAQQWQRAQLAGLDGGMCRVFWSGDDYEAFVRPNESR